MTKNSNNQFRAVSFCLLSLLFFLTTFLSGCRKMPSETTNYITNYFYGDSLTDPNVPLRVVFTNPADGAVGPFNFKNSIYESQYPTITVQFNKLINTYNYLIQNAVRLQYGDVSVPLAYYECINGNIFFFRVTDGRYFAKKVYTVTIDTTLQDVHGYHLSQLYSFSFTPEPEFRVYFFAPSEERVDPIYPPYIYINFNSKLDSDIFEKLSITPAIQGEWRLGLESMTDSTYAFFQTRDTLAYDTKYTVKVAADARDAYGNVIQKPYVYSFTTLPFEARLSGYSSGQGVGWFSLFNDFQFEFNAFIDTSTVRTAISISPPVSFTYYFPWSYHPNYRSVNIILEESQMLPETTYQITLGTSIRSKKGLYMKEPCAFKFTTGSIN